MTSWQARASASGSHTRRFSFRRAFEWSLARHGAQSVSPGKAMRRGRGRGGGRQGGNPKGRKGSVGARGAGPGRGPARHPLPRTHDGPVRDVVLAQHCGQLGVRQNRVVVHGGRGRHRKRSSEGVGAAQAWLHRPSNSCLRAGQGQRLLHACVTLTSQSRAPQAARAARGGAKPLEQPVQTGLAVGAPAAGRAQGAELTSLYVTIMQDWLEEGQGLKASQRGSGAWHVGSHTYLAVRAGVAALRRGVRELAASQDDARLRYRAGRSRGSDVRDSNQQKPAGRWEWAESSI